MSNSSYRWVIVAAGGLLGCMAIGAMFSLPVFLLPISRDTGWSVTGVSSAMTIGFLAMAFASIAWGSSGGVSFELEPAGNKVLLTLIHRRLPDRKTLLMVSAGWHMHLDILVARATGKEPAPFWDGWSRLQKEYDQRLPA